MTMDSLAIPGKEFFTNPGLKRVRMRLITAVIVVFTLVCSGSFGMEDVVSSSGVGLTVLMIIVLPFIWSIPMALVASEMGSAIPEGGGFYRWVRRALPGASGEFWSFQTGWWWTLSLYVDSAVYVALAIGYIQGKVNENGHTYMTDNWRWLLGIGIVGIVTYVNVRGIELTGKALTVIQIVVMVPFIGLVIWGYAKGTGSAIHPFLPPDTGFFSATNLGLAIMMWMYSGYESMSTVAAEVENPQRLIPRAVMVAVPIVIVTYLITTDAGIVAAGKGNWVNMASSGGISFVDAAKTVGGAALAWAVLVSAIASNLGLYTGYLLTGSRPSYSLSRDRVYPRFMGKAHKKWGTPWVAIVVMGALDAIFIKWGFTTLIVIDVFLLMLSYIPIFIAAIALRIREPNLPRPYRVPMPTWLLALYVVLPIAIAVYALFTNGSNYLVAGLIATLSGTAAYLLFKSVYKGTADHALEGSEVPVEGPTAVNTQEPAEKPAPATV